MQFHRLKLVDNVRIPKHIWLLEIYYVFGFLINAVAHYYTLTRYPGQWNFLQATNITLNDLILPILITIITGVFVLFLISERQKKSKDYIYVAPVVIFLTSLISLSMIPSGLNIGFIGFLAAISFFIFIFLLILFYDELPKNEKALELMHKRYIQFLNSFVWLIIVAGTWFVAFFLQQMPPQKTPILPLAFSIAAFQYLFVGGAGLLLAAYAFNDRLRNIENTLNGS